MERQRYLTRFAQLTLAINKEPEDYIKEKIAENWPSGRIWSDLNHIARKFHLQMVSKSTVIAWIKKIKDDGIEQLQV